MILITWNSFHQPNTTQIFKNTAYIYYILYLNLFIYNRKKKIKRKKEREKANQPIATHIQLLLNKESSRRRKMAVDEKKSGAEGKVWGLCKMPFWQSSNGSSSSSSSMQNNNNYNSSNNNNSSSHVYQQNQSQQVMGRSSVVNSSNVSSMAKSLLPTRRRLRLDPSTKLFFPCKSVFFPLYGLFLLKKKKISFGDLIDMKCAFLFYFADFFDLGILDTFIRNEILCCGNSWSGSAVYYRLYFFFPFFPLMLH